MRLWVKTNELPTFALQAKCLEFKASSLSNKCPPSPTSSTPEVLAWISEGHGLHLKRSKKLVHLALDRNIQKGWDCRSDQCIYIYRWSRIMRHSIHHNRGHSRKRHLSAWANYEINFDKEFRFDLDLHCPSLFQIKAGLEKMCPNTFEFCVSACHCVQLTCCNLEMLAPNFFGAQMNLWFDHESNWSSPSNGTLAACQRSHALKFAQPSPEQKLSKFASWVRRVACEMPLFETQTSCIAVAALPKSPNKVHCRSRTSLSQIKQQLAASFTVCNQNHHSSLCTLAMFLHKSQFVGQQLGSSAEKQSNVAVFLSHYVLKLSPSKQFLR